MPSHVEIDSFSYECPSDKMTGSSIISCVIGQVIKSFKLLLVICRDDAENPYVVDRLGGDDETNANPERIIVAYSSVGFYAIAKSVDSYGYI